MHVYCFIFFWLGFSMFILLILLATCEGLLYKKHIDFDEIKDYFDDFGCISGMPSTLYDHYT